MCKQPEKGDAFRQDRNLFIKRYTCVFREPLALFLANVATLVGDRKSDWRVPVAR